MAYFALLWKARTIENYRLKYEREKLNSIKIHNTQIEKKTLFQKWKNYNSRTRKCLSRSVRKLCPEGSAVHTFFVYLVTDQTFPNFLLKSIVGFLAGIIFTYLCFMFFVFQLSISLIHATIMGSIIGVMLTLGLAFSYRIRCLVFLLIPQLFSRVGRYTLTCYALVLILTGPATNTLKNSEVLSESMACVQEQIKNLVKQINHSKEKPLHSIQDHIKGLMDRVRSVTVRIKRSMLKFNRLVLTTAHSLQLSFSWLHSITKECNKILGSPYERCTRALEDSVIECEAKFGPQYAKLCNLKTVADIACNDFKQTPQFCVPVDFLNGNILMDVKKKLKTFTDHLKSLLDVNVKVHHSYTFTSNGSRSGSQVAAGIVTEIRHRAEPLLTWLSWSSYVTSMFLLLIIFRAKHYQHMFETRSRFDNCYVTKELRALDFKRMRQGKETILPLNRRERTKYIKTTSFRLVPWEKTHLSRSLVFMAITSFKLTIHMAADYSLYWVLMTVRYHERFQTPLSLGKSDERLVVTGTGPVARILRALFHSINLPLASPPLSPITCLPDPHPPDLQRYSQIGILIFLLWFFALFEPYGLRLRHVVMGLYRPERAKARAMWLYNHVQRNREGFMKFARRILHRKYKHSQEAKYTLKRWLRDHIPCTCLQYILGVGPEEPRCLLCRTTEYDNAPNTELIRCYSPDCPGIFCVTCFSDIGQLCTICLSPVDYGDLSDMSLEKGSSAESSDGDYDSDGSCTNPGPQTPLFSISENDGHRNTTHENYTVESNQMYMFPYGSNGNDLENMATFRNVYASDSDIKNNVKSEMHRKANVIRCKKKCSGHADVRMSEIKKSECVYCSEMNIRLFDIKSDKSIVRERDKEYKSHYNECDTTFGASQLNNLSSRIHDNLGGWRNFQKKLQFKRRRRRRKAVDLKVLKFKSRRRKKSKHHNNHHRRAINITTWRKEMKVLELNLESNIDEYDYSRNLKFRKSRKILKRKRKKDVNVKINLKARSDIIITECGNTSLNFSKSDCVLNVADNFDHHKCSDNRKSVNLMFCSQMSGDSNITLMPLTPVNNNGNITRKKHEKKPKKGIKIEIHRSAIHFLGKIRDLYTGHGRYDSKSIASRIKTINYRRNDIKPTEHEKANHKRRKKFVYDDDDDRFNDTLAKNDRVRKDIEDRKFRLFNFLTEQDWVPWRFRSKLTLDPGQKYEPSLLSKASATNRNKGDGINIIARNNIEALKAKIYSNFKKETLPLNENWEYVTKERTISNLQCVSDEVTPGRLKNIRTEDRKIGCNEGTAGSNNEYPVFRSTQTEPRTPFHEEKIWDFNENHRYLRAMKYFKDLGHADFVDEDEFLEALHQEEKNIEVRKQAAKKLSSVKNTDKISSVLRMDHLSSKSSNEVSGEILRGLVYPIFKTIRNFYQTFFGAKLFKEDKSIAVFPVVQSRACQKVCDFGIREKQGSRLAKESSQYMMMGSHGKVTKQYKQYSWEKHKMEEVSPNIKTVKEAATMHYDCNKQVRDVAVQCCHHRIKVSRDTNEPSNQSPVREDITQPTKKPSIEFILHPKQPYSPDREVKPQSTKDREKRPEAIKPSTERDRISKLKKSPKWQRKSQQRKKSSERERKSQHVQAETARHKREREKSPKPPRQTAEPVVPAEVPEKQKTTQRAKVSSWKKNRSNQEGKSESKKGKLKREARSPSPEIRVAVKNPSPVQGRNLSEFRSETIIHPSLSVYSSESNIQKITYYRATLDLDKNRKTNVDPRNNLVHKQTGTDNRNSRDASTTTSDWWTPLVERKSLEGQTNTLAKVPPIDVQTLEFDKSSVPVSEKQHLPSRCILKYQNICKDLFSYRASPRLFSILQGNLTDKQQKSITSKRSHKRKRLEDRHSPRKVPSPRWLTPELKWKPERNKMLEKRKRSKAIAMKHYVEYCKNLKDELSNLKKHETLIRDAVSNDNMSMTNNCFSIGTQD